ncbi:U1 snrnp [Cryptosporidium ryanae]|uniref:U1 snrnp n=1 Tax=Cryptosporidium ryanae TaxID=515981 RepID=UPI00351A2552|nr:U1 snrnp [Cryptosporidium ryanae]
MSTQNEGTIKTINKGLDISNEKNNTIYINNLNEKIPILELKEALNNFFSRFGVISSIKCFNSFYRKGQAWISFESVESAEIAVKNGKNVVIFGRPMRVSFSVENSRSYPKEKIRNEYQMIPKSIKSRIELYKLYLDQWLKHVKTHKLIDLSEDSREKPSSIIVSSNIWNSGYTNNFKKHGIENLQLISRQYLTGLKDEPDFPVGVPSIKNSKSIDISKTDSKNTTVFVQITSGKCKEEDLKNIFQSICGFKELRYTPVSFGNTTR